ncbi:MAG TPA: GGDEF domain-containing protein [Janthinobacterium sp.]|nr:GGDEF domain-containing protein [Janthinobacterium sp.]
MFINPELDRRAAFQGACRDLFQSLQLEASVASAMPVLARQRIDLLVIDLHRFNHRNDLPSLGELVRSRGGARTLVLCPFDAAGWIPDLMAYGPIEYMIAPSSDAELQQTVRQALQRIDRSLAPELIEFQLLATEKELRELLVIQRNLQRALAETEDAALVAEQVCLALCSFPGVCHSALFHLKERADLQLVAQESRNHLDLTRLLDRGDRLLQSPLRDVFPALIAADGGAMVLLDAPEKAGHPELAVSLRDRDVRMVLAIPLARDGGAAVQGAISLMFDRGMQFSREQFACFSSLAQLVSFGLAMAELKRRNDALLEQMTRVGTTDTLTGAINRRQGELYLTREIGRARRYAVPLALITFDVVNVRSSDDPCRDPAIDAALRSVVMATQARLRGADSLVRMSDDEFLIIAPHTQTDGALRMAEKIRAAVAEADLPGSEELTISFGVAQLGDGESGAAVMQRLDEALFRARKTGPNRVELALM